jgi:hypothetical protein
MQKGSCHRQTLLKTPWQLRAGQADEGFKLELMQGPGDSLAPVRALPYARPKKFKFSATVNWPYKENFCAT